MPPSNELHGLVGPGSINNAQLQALALEADFRDASWSYTPELRRLTDLVAERCACRWHGIRVGVLIALLAIGAGAAHADFSGRVIGVLDGDTVDVLVDLKPVRVRLAEIDAPEKAQPWGTRSRQALWGFAFGQLATVKEQGTDRYKRTIGTLVIDGRSVNRAMVDVGMAWVYPQYLRDRTLLDAQRQARAQGRGLWADSDPVPQWEWRATRRGSAGE